MPRARARRGVLARDCTLTGHAENAKKVARALEGGNIGFRKAPIECLAVTAECGEYNGSS